MSADQAFLQAICEAPDDDAPRLMYADWLTEHGHPRGEFIRAQIELRSLPDDDPRRPYLVARERQLLVAHRREWDRPLLALGCLCGEYVRGFLSHVELDAETFLARADQLFTATPVSEVVLRRAAGLETQLATLPAMERVMALSLPSNWIGTAGSQQLFASGRFTRLASLGLRLNDIGDAGVTALTLCKSLDRLTALDLSGNRITSGGLYTLVRWPRMAHVTRLSLASNQVGAASLAVLTEATRGWKLADLDLTGNGNLGALGVRALATWKHRPALKVLRLGRRGLTGAELRTLRDYGLFEDLIELDLHGNNQLGDAIRVLVLDPVVRSLKTLDLRGIRLSRQAIEALVKSPHLGGLRRLKANYFIASPEERKLLEERFGEGLSWG